MCVFHMDCKRKWLCLVHCAYSARSYRSYTLFLRAFYHALLVSTVAFRVVEIVQRSCFGELYLWFWALLCSIELREVHTVAFACAHFLTLPIHCTTRPSGRSCFAAKQSSPIVLLPIIVNDTYKEYTFQLFSQPLQMTFPKENFDECLKHVWRSIPHHRQDEISSSLDHQFSFVTCFLQIIVSDDTSRPKFPG